jgi:hypothetical protein
MRITITKGGIYGADGKEVPVGTELTVADHDDDTPHPWAGRFEVISGGDEAKAKGGKKTPVTNPAKYEAKAKGDEWFIFDAGGKEQGGALPEKDAEDFNGLSDELKVAFVAEHTKA